MDWIVGVVLVVADASELAVSPSGQKFICSSVVPTGKADMVGLARVATCS